MSTVMDLDPVPGFWALARRHPTRIALVGLDGRELTYGELGARVDRLSHALRRFGLGRGSVLAVALPNCFEYIEVFLATQQIGVNVLALGTGLAPTELRYILSDSGATMLVTSDDLSERIAPEARRSGVPGDNVLVTGTAGSYETAIAESPLAPVKNRTAGTTMLYTSGTTGKPKGVRRLLPATATPEEIYAGHARRMIERFDWSPGSGVFLVCGPLYHRASNVHAIHALMMGHTVVLTAKWDPEQTLELIEQHRVTETHMVPTMFHRLLGLPEEVRDRYDTSSLTSVIHAAALCPVEEKRQMLSWWGPVIYEYYAATEGGGTAVRPAEWIERPGTVGRPWTGANVQVRDETGEKQLPPGSIGTIWISLQGQDFEYLNDPEKTAASRRDGLFTAGDMGWLDDAGYLFIADRRSDLIISGGVNIYPAEIENALLRSDLVDEVAVVGIPDPDWGASVKAVVVLNRGVVKADAEEALRANAIEHLANFKRPKVYQFVPSLPRSEIGKVLKKELQ